MPLGLKHFTNYRVYKLISLTLLRKLFYLEDLLTDLASEDHQLASVLPLEVVRLAYVAELCFFLFDEGMEFLDGSLTVQ